MIDFLSCQIVQTLMKCRFMQHFIWAITVSTSTCLGVAGPQRVEDFICQKWFDISSLQLRQIQISQEYSNLFKNMVTKGKACFKYMALLEYINVFFEPISG